MAWQSRLSQNQAVWGAAKAPKSGCAGPPKALWAHRAPCKIFRPKQSFLGTNVALRGMVVGKLKKTPITYFFLFGGIAARCPNAPKQEKRGYRRFFKFSDGNSPQRNLPEVRTKPRKKRRVWCVQRFSAAGRCWHMVFVFGVVPWWRVHRACTNGTLRGCASAMFAFFGLSGALRCDALCVCGHAHARELARCVCVRPYVHLIPPISP